MKQNNYLRLCIGVMMTGLVWSITATVVCVKQDRKVQHLEELVARYKDLYHGCLRGKMRLRDQERAPGQDISFISGTARIESKKVAVSGTWVFSPNLGVFISSHNQINIIP